MKKVILISIDGMRPDGLKTCGSEFLNEILNKSSYTFDAKTVYPSITLPCHLSLFHSVPPERHGTTTNTYVVPVRPVSGLFEQLKIAGKKSAMFFGWEPMRDIGRPKSLAASEYIDSNLFEHSDAMVTERALNYIKFAKPDFIFLYMAETDDKGGHDCGWMSETYLDYVKHAINNVKKVIDEVGEEYTIIVTSDHGGHGRTHGTDMPEDMTIPMIFCGSEFEKNKELKDINILDIAPTIAEIMCLDVPREWEGKSILK